MCLVLKSGPWPRWQAPETETWKEMGDHGNYLNLIHNNRLGWHDVRFCLIVN